MTSTGTSLDLLPPTDAQLIAASRFDGVHFAAVVDRHLAEVHGYLARRLGAPTADAHLGESLLAAYANRRHFRSWEESARPWLTGVATNVVRKQWRIEQSRLRELGAAVAGAPAGGDRPDAEGVIERLQHLSARDRDLVMLAAWEELSAPAIATALDLPERVVAARLDGAAHLVSGSAVVDAVVLVRSLRPAVTAPPEALVEAVRSEVADVTGAGSSNGRRRPTSAIAAEREQLRRWRSGPTARLAARRAGRTG